jgi:hypothetical protein
MADRLAAALGGRLEGTTITGHLPHRSGSH